MTSAERTHLFNLIDEACTNAQISSVLRLKKKNDKKIRVSGSSPELMRHLKEAHQRHAVTDDDLVNLLAMGEENGRQHIFLYRVLPHAKSRYQDFDKLHNNMTSESGVSESHLPRFVLAPTAREISDVRFQRLANDQRNLLVS